MAKYPVTNVQFKCFVDAAGYNQGKYWTKVGWAWRHGDFGQKPDVCPDEDWNWITSRKNFGHPEGWEDQFPPERANHPVVNVTWHEALAYTRWLAEATGKPYRLPTEVEWEKATRGDKDKREYPWGDRFDPKKVNMSIGREQVEGTSPVGIYPGGGSPYGILDLSGNVWEWCSSLYRDYPYDPDDGREHLEVKGYRVARGGSWAVSDGTVARCSSRGPIHPADFDVSLGFRVCVAL
jgi:formylglycine-generating enzyme required for sulfatase activity